MVSARLQTLLPSLKLDKSAKYSFTSLHRLDPNTCPLHPRPAVIKVINKDSVNAAIALAASAAAQDPNVRNPRPAVVNFANHQRPGGGWLNGAVAQEEAICYRTTLGLALHKMFYPFAMEDALYTPDVAVVRNDMASGHALLTPATPAHHLPVVSILSVAAILRPAVHTFDVPTDDGVGGGGGRREKPVFARDKDRGVTKAKMRLCLRMAAVHGHGLLVLGALGCGVFANPPEDVAHCWLEVLREDEFRGNWWREVCFAVYEPKGGGNFAVFKKVLDGKEV